MKNKKILFLGAHPDDEFGCAGSLLKFIEEGAEVYYAVFSFCEESVPEGFPKDVLRNEFSNSLKVLGVKPENVIQYDYKVRNFPSRRQEILEDIVALKKKISPDLVMIPALTDIHQDHHTIAMEGVRAFKHATILGYELPQNTITFKHACFVCLKEDQIQKKIKALMSYESQAKRPYMSESFIAGVAKIRGVQIDEEYAEAFEVIRFRL